MLPVSPESLRVRPRVVTVKLPAFEGPLDLLLYLIKKNEVDVFNIPIAAITEEYLGTLEQLRAEGLDLEAAGEYLVMAATLIHVKSKLLLPPEETAAGEDPRTELVRQLLAYQQVKEAADRLLVLEGKQRDVFARFSEEDELVEEEYVEATLYDLLKAFQKVLIFMPKDAFKEVGAEEFNVGEKMRDIVGSLERQERIQWSSVFSDLTRRGEVIAMFLAVLELVRLKMIRVIQHQHFGDLILVRTADVLPPLPGGAGDGQQSLLPEGGASNG